MVMSSMWTERESSYHVSVVGVEGLIDQRERIRTQPLLIIDELGKLVERRKVNSSTQTSD